MSGEQLPGVTATEILDFSELGGINCYCDDDNAELMAGCLQESRDNAPVLNWIDTGDYHYLSALTMAGIAEDFILLLIDRHPDTQRPAFGNVLSCGGWLRSLLESNPHLRTAFLFGVNPALAPEYEDLAGERLAVVEDLSFPADSLPGLPVYISIDLDALSRNCARTDWDQGDMTIEELEHAVRTVLCGRRLLGVDICGGLTAGKGASPEDDSVNAATRRELRRFLTSLP